MNFCCVYSQNRIRVAHYFKSFLFIYLNLCLHWNLLLSKTFYRPCLLRNWINMKHVVWYKFIPLDIKGFKVSIFPVFVLSPTANGSASISRRSTVCTCLWRTWWRRGRAAWSSSTGCTSSTGRWTSWSSGSPRGKWWPARLNWARTLSTSPWVCYSQVWGWGGHLESFFFICISSGLFLLLFLDTKNIFKNSWHAGLIKVCKTNLI